MEKEYAKSAQQCREILTKEALPPARTFYRRRFLPDLHLFYKKRTSDRQAAVTIRSPNQSLLSKSVLPALAVPRRRAGTAFRTPDARGEDFPRSPTGGNIMPGSVKESTNSSLSMDQLYLLLQKQFQKTYKEMKQTLTTYQELTGGTPDLAPVNDGFPPF